MTSIRRQPSPLLVARILTMVLDNGTALATRRPRPHSVGSLNILRSQLLEDPFFDNLHRPEELRPRLRTSRILFMNIVVLMARLLRVLMRQGPLTDTERAERIDVRNECMNQPFFHRRLINSARPFVDEDFEDFEDEGCVV